MMHNYRRPAALVFLMLFASVMLMATAAADPTTENVTKLKEGIVEVLANP